MIFILVWLVRAETRMRSSSHGHFGSLAVSSSPQKPTKTNHTLLERKRKERGGREDCGMEKEKERLH